MSLIPYAGKLSKHGPGFARVAVISLQAENRNLSKELYDLKSKHILLERELERAKVRVLALERALIVVGEVARDHSPKLEQMGRYNIEDVANMAAIYFQLPLEVIRGHSRSREAVHARHITMYLASSVSGATRVAIGRFLGGRDHTTVCAGITRIQRCLSTDASMAQDVALIRARLNQNATPPTPQGPALGAAATTPVHSVAAPLNSGGG